MKLILIFALIVPVFLANPCCAQESSATPVPIATPSQNTSADLQLFLQKLQEAVDTTITNKNGEKLASLWEATKIPDPETWFTTTFGPENGAKLAARYPDYFKKSEDHQIQYFIVHGEPGGRITAAIVPLESDHKEPEFQRQFEEAIRKSLKTPAQFFRVDYKWISKDGSASLRSLGYVTLVDGNYRTFSDSILHGLPGNPVGRIRQGGNVQASKLLD